MRQIGDIKIYSVDDLHEALGINRRTIRDWFNKRKLQGRKVGKEWMITESNLKVFLEGEKGGELTHKELKTNKAKRSKDEKKH